MCRGRPARSRRSATSRHAGPGSDAGPGSERAGFRRGAGFAIGGFALGAQDRGDPGLPRALALDVGVLDEEQAPGSKQQCGLLRQRAHHLQPVGSAIERQVRGRGRAPPAPVGSRPRARTGGWLTTTSTDPRRYSRASPAAATRVASAASSSIELPMAATRAAWSAMFRRAQSTAAGDSSTAMTRLPGSSVAIDSASAADPEQRSTTNGPRPAAGRDSPAGRGGRRTTPGPDSGPGAIPLGREPQHVVDHQLRLRTRDEHAGPDAQLEVAEWGEAGQVLQRDPLDPLGDERGEGVGLLVGDGAPGHPQQGARPTGDVRKQQLGVHLRRGHTRGSQLGGGSRQKIPGRLHRSTLFLLTRPVGPPADSRAAPWTDRIRTTSGTIRTPVSDLRHSALRRRRTLPQDIGKCPGTGAADWADRDGRLVRMQDCFYRLIDESPTGLDTLTVRVHSTQHTTGPWAAGLQHAGPPSALLTGRSAALAGCLRRASGAARASTSLAPSRSPTWCSEPGHCARVARWRWPRRRWPRPTPPTGRS